MFKKILLGALGLLLIAGVAQAADPAWKIESLTTFGNMHVSMGTVTCVISDYDTLGWAVSPPKFGMSEVKVATFNTSAAVAMARYQIVYDYTNDKILLYDVANADSVLWLEEATDTNVTGTIYFFAVGR